VLARRQLDIRNINTACLHELFDAWLRHFIRRPLINYFAKSKGAHAARIVPAARIGIAHCFLDDDMSANMKTAGLDPD
jgi:hypothetical protein